MTNKTLAAVASGAAVVATAAYLLIKPAVVVQPPPVPPPTLITPTGVMLEWDAVPDDCVIGYAAYCGIRSHEYDTRIDAGTNITATVSNLIVGNTYYFAVTAYASNGVESDFSGEISLALPASIIEMTFSFPTDVAPPTIQSSADLMTWTNVSARIVSSTNQNVVVRAFVNQSAQYFRAVGVAP